MAHHALNCDTWPFALATVLSDLAPVPLPTGALSRQLGADDVDRRTAVPLRSGVASGTRLLAPDPEGLGPGCPVVAYRQAMASWTEVAIDGSVSRQELLGVAGRLEEPVAQSPIGTERVQRFACFGVDGSPERRFDRRYMATRIEQWLSISGTLSGDSRSCFRPT